MFLSICEMGLVRRLIERDSFLRLRENRAWAERAARQGWPDGHNDDTRAALLLARIENEERRHAVSVGLLSAEG